jgi:hypothetical protein
MPLAYQFDKDSKSSLVFSAECDWLMTCWNLNLSSLKIKAQIGKEIVVNDDVSRTSTTIPSRDDERVSSDFYSGST